MNFGFLDSLENVLWFWMLFNSILYTSKIFSLDEQNKGLLFSLLLSIALIGTFRGGVIADFLHIKQLLTEPNELFSIYALFLLLFAPPINLETIRKVFETFHKWRYVWLIFSVLLFIFTRDEIGKGVENAFIHWLTFLVLILFFYGRLPRNVIFLVSFLIISYFVIFVWGRRGRTIHIALMMLYPIIYWLQSILRKRKQIVSKQVLWVLLFLPVLLVPLALNLNESKFMERGFDKQAFEQSRGEVFSEYFSDFHDYKEYLFGRGLLGSVKRNLGGIELANDIENGWLTLILRFGLIFTFPLFLILLYYFWQGFTSQYFLVGLSGWNILVYIIDLMISDLLGFDPRLMLVVVSIMIVKASNSTDMSNYSIKRIIS